MFAKWNIMNPERKRDDHERKTMTVSDSPAGSWRAIAASAIDQAARIVVCGIGNDLRGDDAAGVLCLRSLERRFASAETSPRAVLFIDGGETPENETSRIRAFRPDLVILIDAARSGRRPGDVFLVEKEAISDEEVSTHRISLALLVRFIEESIGARVLFLGIEPESTDSQTAVSAAVLAAVEAVGENLAAML